MQFEKSQEIVEGKCRNISIGGMFVVAQCPEPPGSTVRFELGLEDGAAIRGLAEVMWASEAGFGLKFKYLEQRDRQLIFRLVSRHIKDRLATRHTPASEESAPAEGLVVPPVVARPDLPPDEDVPSFEMPEVDYSALPEEDQPRSSIFDREQGLGEAADVEASPPEVAVPPPESVLPDDWDDDPTAFNRPVADLTQPPEPMPEPSAPVSAPAPATSSDGPMEPRSLESEAGSLSEVFMSSRGFDLDLPLDPEAGTEPDLRLDSEEPSEGPSEPYLQHLGADHFEHRPAPKRDLPILPVAALVLVLAAALGYLFSDQIFDFVHEDTVVPVASGDAGGSEPPSEEGLADAAGDRTSDPPPKEQAAPPMPRASQPSPPPPAPPRAQSAAPKPRSQPTGQSGPAFQRLTDVTWRVAGSGLTLTLATDGRTSAERVDHFRLEGDSPREVIRLLGMKDKYAQPNLTIGKGGVKQVRFGWHKKRAGNEVHLVLDMDDSRSRILGTRVEGTRILVDVGR